MVGSGGRSAICPSAVSRSRAGQARAISWSASIRDSPHVICGAGRSVSPVAMRPRRGGMMRRASDANVAPARIGIGPVSRSSSRRCVSERARTRTVPPTVSVETMRSRPRRRAQDRPDTGEPTVSVTTSSWPIRARGCVSSLPGDQSLPAESRGTVRFKTPGTSERVDHVTWPDSTGMSASHCPPYQDETVGCQVRAPARAVSSSQSGPIIRHPPVTSRCGRARPT